MNPQKSIALLNHAVAEKLQAFHQYTYWHFHLRSRQPGPVADLFSRVASLEIQHVESLAARILSLEGDVDITAAGPVERIKEPVEILHAAARMKREAMQLYNQLALQAGANDDATSKQLLESLAEHDRSHYGAFTAELEMLHP